jgi:ferredoxin
MLHENEKVLFGKNYSENQKSIFLGNQEYKVPSEVNLLRALHFICLEYDDYEIKLQKHCWGGTCENCKCTFQDEQLEIAEGLACQMEVEENLKIEILPRTMKKKIPHGN